MQLTTNFTLSEALEWHRHQPISQADVQRLRAWIDQTLSDLIKANITAVAHDLQSIRNAVNAAFPAYKGRIGIRPISWYRPRQWELHRNRSGASEHIHGHAVDFIAVNVTAQDYPAVMLWIWNHLNASGGYNGGLARLMTGNRWSFIHIDKGRKRRWEY